MSVATLVRRRSYGRLHLHRRRFDWDAQLYFNRLRSAAGVELSVDDRTNVSGFCRGLKKLGYWNALVEGWTFRSGQNAGLGATAYGIKGVKDGVIFGAPTWGTTGITLDTNAKGITLPSLTTFSGTSPWTLILVFDYLGADVNRPLFAYAGTTASQPNTIAIECASTSPLIRRYNAGTGVGITPSVADPAAGFGVVWAGRTSSDWAILQNRTGLDFGSDLISLATPVDYNIGNRFSDSQLTADAVFAHCLLFNVANDNVPTPGPIVTSKLLQLLKDTISSGLSLP